MARIRTIKPEFFTSSDILELTPLARLFYIALWCEADREGLLNWSPKTLKFRYLPGDEIEVEEIAEELISAGLIMIFTCDDGKELASIPSFKNHQVINNRESDSILDRRVKAALPRVKAEGKEGREGKGREGKEEEANASVTSDEKPSKDDVDCKEQENQLKCPIGHIVDAYHAAMPLNPQVKVLNDARKKTISARWREASQMAVEPFGYSTILDGLAAWKEFFTICNESPFLTGRAKAQPGKPPFIADIDFLMSPSGFTSTLENKYHREVA
jgi:hypothetical protein